MEIKEGGRGGRRSLGVIFIVEPFSKFAQEKKTFTKKIFFTIVDTVHDLESCPTSSSSFFFSWKGIYNQDP
jgi:hypothetical protein